MPNHIINEIIFRDLSEAQIADIRARTLNIEGRVDFFNSRSYSDQLLDGER